MARTSLTLPFSGAKLRGLRERKGWRQEDLSARTAEAGRKIDRARISLYETGTALPSAQAYRVLVDVLGCEEDDLLDDEAVSA